MHTPQLLSFVAVAYKIVSDRLEELGPFDDTRAVSASRAELRTKNEIRSVEDLSVGQSLQG